MSIIATPFTIIERRDEAQDVAAIVKIVEQNSVKIIIVGLPRLMDGSIGQQAEKVQAFVQSLRRQTQVPIEFRDERLTTVSARRLMKLARTKKLKKKAEDDAAAAAVILQSYLEEQGAAGNRWQPEKPEMYSSGLCS